MEKGSAVNTGTGADAPVVAETPEKLQESAYAEVFEKTDDSDKGGKPPEESAKGTGDDKAKDAKADETKTEGKKEGEKKPEPTQVEKEDAALLDYYSKNFGLDISSPAKIKAGLKAIHKVGIDYNSRIGLLSSKLTEATKTIEKLKKTPPVAKSAVVDAAKISAAFKQLPAGAFDGLSKEDREMIEDPGFQKAFGLLYSVLSGQGKTEEPAKVEEPVAASDQEANIARGQEVIREIAGQVNTLAPDLPAMLPTYSSPQFDKFIKDVVKNEVEQNKVIFPDGADMTALSPTYRRLVSIQPTDHVEVLKMFDAWTKEVAKKGEDDKNTEQKAGDLAGHGKTNQTRIKDAEEESPQDILALPKAEYAKRRDKILKGG